jgi:hypothetical protein
VTILAGCTTNLEIYIARVGKPRAVITTCKMNPRRPNEAMAIPRDPATERMLRRATAAVRSITGVAACGTIRGGVIDRDTGMPVRGATIQISAGALSSVTLSDSMGSFSLGIADTTAAMLRVSRGSRNVSELHLEHRFRPNLGYRMSVIIHRRQLSTIYVVEESCSG